MLTDDQQPWTNTYWVDDKYGWQDDYYHVPLERGDGILVSKQGGRRFRVVDIWYSDDRHGHFDLGRHIFLKDVTDTDDDRLGTISPEYFSA
jgi:hypothetical protein